jgi:GntR family transcriptional regulator
LADDASNNDGFNAELLNGALPTPLYHQVYLVLRERIQAGVYAEGATLPGEQELARAFDVSRITVKRALNELAANNLVTRHRGRGTIVTLGGVIPLVSGSFETLISSLRSMGLTTEVELLEVSDEPADALVAERLRLEPGAAVQRAVRLRKLQGEPFSYLTTYVPAAIAKRYTIEDLRSTPLLALLERAGAGAVEAEQWITAASASLVVSKCLDVPSGSPVLKIERTMIGPDGSPVQMIVGHYRPDRFQYHMTSKRQSDAEGWT